MGQSLFWSKYGAALVFRPFYECGDEKGPVLE